MPDAEARHHRGMVTRLAVVLALLLAAVGLVACGDSDDAPPAGGPDAVARAASATAKAGTAATKITVDVNKHKLMTIDFSQVADAKLVMTDRLIAATAPLSTEGADEVFSQDTPTDEPDAHEADTEEGQH